MATNEELINHEHLFSTHNPRRKEVLRLMSLARAEGAKEERKNNRDGCRGAGCCEDHYKDGVIDGRAVGIEIGKKMRK